MLHCFSGFLINLSMNNLRFSVNQPLFLFMLLSCSVSGSNSPLKVVEQSSLTINFTGVTTIRFECSSAFLNPDLH